MKHSKNLNLVLQITLTTILISLNNHEAEAFIGMNWGRNNAQRLLPSVAVDLLLQNGVKEARIYTSQRDILDAFVGTNIKLSISIFNVGYVSTPEKASEWVQQKIVPYFDLIDIRRIVIGNQPFDLGLTNHTKQKVAVDALQYVQSALNDAGYGDKVKATIPHTDRLMKHPLERPSDAEFHDEVKDEMLRYLRILKQNNAPYVLEMMPVTFLPNSSFDPSFAYADGNSLSVVEDVNGTTYTNVFDFLYDSTLWSLRKMGMGDLEVVVGMVGWPTDGCRNASAEVAERFFKHLLPHVASDRGTPLRPGGPIDVFVHSLTDENKNPHDYPFTRHWGIYRSNGEPKYKIDLSGRGRDIYPTKGSGIFRMPSRWCVVDKERFDVNEALVEYESACKKSDCTSLESGGSCSNLTFEERVSYALNMQFQFAYQSEKACKNCSFSKVVTEDPSVMGCVFPIEVTVQDREQSKSDGSKLCECAVFLSLICLVLTFL